MIILKTPQEIEKIRQSAQIAKRTMNKVLGEIVPGISTLGLDELIARFLKEEGAVSSFLGVNGYKFSSCISVNDELVHGLPSKDKILKEGDLVSVDMGAKLGVWNSDMCRTFIVSEKSLQKSDPDKLRKLRGFLNVGIEALEKGLLQVKSGGCVGNISSEIQKTVEKYKCSVARDLVGHGVGKSLHEDPQIPCFGRFGTGEELEIGMVLAVEVMYMEKSPNLVVEEDGWTFKTADGGLSAMFEDLVAITSSASQVLTR